MMISSSQQIKTEPLVDVHAGESSASQDFDLEIVESSPFNVYKNVVGSTQCSPNIECSQPL
jgi:hypothetical protein